MKNIYLIGFMGSGKSYIGKLLADYFHLSFIDLDKFIEDSRKQTIPEIFNLQGEAGFRNLESFYLKKTSDFTQTIISCGGGTPCFNENMKWIKQNGISIYFKTTTSLLFERLKKQKAGRPLISKMSDIELNNFIINKIMEREYFYSQADFISIQNNNEALTPDLMNYISNFVTMK
jgi:shikimate kinase